VPGHDTELSLAPIGLRLRLHVQAEVGLPVVFVRTVAGEAAVGQNRPDVLVESDVGGSTRRCEYERNEEEPKDGSWHQHRSPSRLA
jgi:hypothetical protein